MIRNEMRLTLDMTAINDLDVMTQIPVTGTGSAWDQTYYPESIQRRMSFDEGCRMTCMLLHASRKQHRIVLPIIIVDEDGTSIDTPLGDVNWNAWNRETGAGS